MPSIKDSVAADTSRYEPVDTAVGIGGRAGFPPVIEGQPTLNPFLRCPMPPISVTPDSLRQYYSGGQIPQFRVLTPPNSSSGAGRGSGTIIINNNAASTAVSTSSTSGGSATLSPVLTSTTTPVLGIDGIFVGTIPISKSFQLISLTASSPCRVEIYGSAQSRTLDAGRGLDIAPLPGTQQNLITDVVLDTSPLTWSWQNRVGANADSPQSPLAYVTITNIGAGSVPITISVVYIPLESA
jgi:hypothetical protein